MLNFECVPIILKEQRRYMGYTQKNVADRLQIPYQDYQKYEYGLVMPKIDRYKELCIILNIPISNQVYMLKKD